MSRSCPAAGRHLMTMTVHEAFERDREPPLFLGHLPGHAGMVAWRGRMAEGCAQLTPGRFLLPVDQWPLGRLGLRHCLWIDQREHSRFATSSGYGEPAQR